MDIINPIRRAFCMLASRQRGGTRLAFTLAFVGGFLRISSVAGGEWVRKSAHDCYPAFVDECWNDQCVGTSNNGVYNSWDNDEALWLVCPVTDTSEFPKATISSLNVHGRDGSSIDEVRAEVCIGFAVPQGGTTAWMKCSSDVGSGATYVGNFGLPMGSRAKTLFAEDSTAFGYILVMMSHTSATTRLYGIYQAD